MNEKPKRDLAPGLRVYWSKREKDLMFHYDTGTARADNRLVHNALCAKRFLTPNHASPSLVEELEARGYDLTTLRLTVRKKKPEVPK